MAIQLMSTKGYATNGVKILCHGQSGAGKTYLIRTLPNPVIISAESGLLSLHDTEFPYVEVQNLEQLYEVYTWVTGSDEAKQFDSIALDSISEIAEVVLSEEKAKTRDGRAAYGETNDKMAQLIRAFRDIRGKHVYFSAKTEKLEDESKRIYYGPAMPGKTLTQGIAYYFDIVLALRAEKTEDGIARMLQCETDGLWTAKNRGGYLSTWEEPDLGAIIAKVQGGGK